MKDFDPSNKSHLFLGATNVFNYWFLAVLAVALAKLSGQPFIRTMIVMLGFWLILSFLLISVGLGQFVL